jgi:transcriptional regulator with XRE-family HTH domain
VSRAALTPDDRAVYAEVGARLRAARRRTVLTQDALARLAGISRPSVSNIEAGRQSVTLALFLSLCDALGADPAELLGPDPGDGP